MLADLAGLRDVVDAVVCPGNLTRRFLVGPAGFDPTRVRHIPNGADGPTVPRVTGPPGGPLRLVYVGRMSEGDKRVSDLPRLCRTLGDRGIDYRLTVVGDGPARDAVAAGMAPFAERAEMLGALPVRKVYEEIYPRADVLLLFSASEAFGIVLAEAMRNGVVPVTSRYVGFQSEGLVVEGTHGLSFPVGDTAAAADRVAALAADRALLARLSAAGTRHADEHYSWERCLSAWEQALGTLAEAPSRAVSAETLRRTFADRPALSGRLDRLGVPRAVTDIIRRARRTTLRAAVPPGGEEWPLFRGGPADRRAWVQQELERLESGAAAAGVARRPNGAPLKSKLI
ncbi:glycosyltransferase family 4 protein [Alienimonas chondri]